MPKTKKNTFDHINKSSVDKLIHSRYWIYSAMKRTIWIDETMTLLYIIFDWNWKIDL